MPTFNKSEKFEMSPILSLLAKKKKTPSRSSSFNCLSPGVEKLLSLGQPEVQNNNWNFCGAEGGGIVFV